MKNKPLLLIVMFVALSINQQAANSAPFLAAPTNCAGLAGIPANQIYKYNPDGMKLLLRQGCPPPKSWNKAINHELAAGGGASGFSGASRVPAHKSSLGYKVKGACSNYKVTKPGGLSDIGAIDPCTTGAGFPFFNIKIPMPNIPSIGNNEINCMGNLIDQILNGGIAIDFNFSGGCATGTLRSANIGQCGINSVSGSVCATNNGAGELTSTAAGPITKPFSRVTNPKYIPISSIPTMKYINNPLNQMTSMYLPNGGTVQTERGTYNLDAGMFVTMNADGEVFIGPNWSGGCSEPAGGTNCRIALIPSQPPSAANADPAVGSYVTINPTGGVINADSTIFEGDTLNKQVNYTRYTPSNNVNTNDGRTPSANYDPRVNVTDQVNTIGPGAQNCISNPTAALAGLPAAQDGCVGAQRVGLSDLVLDTNGEPTVNCPPSLSMFCVQPVNQNVNDNAPAAAQQQ